MHLHIIEHLDAHSIACVTTHFQNHTAKEQFENPSIYMLYPLMQAHRLSSVLNLQMQFELCH